MAESDEHKFLSEETISILKRLSGSRLYGFKESERKKFDFTCELKRDWSRALSGQTLWRHSEGIDKDLRILLSDDETKISLYVARDTTSNHRATWEIIEDFKKTPLRDRLSRLRIIWIPSNFDSDKEDDRTAVSRHLQERIAKDLLVSTILGGVSSTDISHLLGGGISGLNLALIESIARAGFVNMPNLAERLHVSTTTVRNRVHILAAAGLLDQPNPSAQMYQTSLRGKVILDICRALFLATRSEDTGLTEEMIYILEVLGLEYMEKLSREWRSATSDDPLAAPTAKELFEGLVDQALWATKQFDLEWSESYFENSIDSERSAWLKRFHAAMSSDG
ncbi:DeoR family transcriptional regulator [Herbidospora sp. NBRC 101105]|uniref:DeoR family transcriptional regulator n=1 Tax=Herbidospora sp. NBRC 101105 TaxID=3032195 RepID=UPI0024A011BF|nr:DeoR family transcriptional regulator [Herbidospora sp. NBRC 101105]GLX96215.1 hypothetical protein Hesp01_41650 [Herbidospora sp. NBRC 101105]